MYIHTDYRQAKPLQYSGSIFAPQKTFYVKDCLIVSYRHDIDWIHRITLIVDQSMIFYHSVYILLYLSNYVIAISHHNHMQANSLELETLLFVVCGNNSHFTRRFLEKRAAAVQKSKRAPHKISLLFFMYCHQLSEAVLRARSPRLRIIYAKYSIHISITILTHLLTMF